jgi:hypothetical protein
VKWVSADKRTVRRVYIVQFRECSAERQWRKLEKLYGATSKSGPKRTLLHTVRRNVEKKSRKSKLAVIITFTTIVPSEARMSELKFVSWKEIFQKAIEETDRDKRAQLVQQSDLAIFHRQQQLYNCDRYREELSAMNAATEALRVMKHAARELERSGWPLYRTKSA